MPDPYHSLCDLIVRRCRESPEGVTFIVGIAGSVAVGKSTTARIVQSLLTERAGFGRVERVSTDGFLYANVVLEQRQLAHRKGFPESYDRAALLRFLAAVKAGTPDVGVPVYDHRLYDLIAGQIQPVGHPDVLLLEGLNVLQAGPPPMVSDYLDLSVYVDAATDDIRSWYVSRFAAQARAAADDPGSFFAPWSSLAETEIVALAEAVWEHVNAVNLNEHILPTRERADVILHKAADHAVTEIRYGD